MKKSIIRNCGINGLRLDGTDVARVSRCGTMVRLRHNWDNEDGRAQHAVMSAARDLARNQARRRDVDITIVDNAGYTLDVISPDLI